MTTTSSASVQAAEDHPLPKYNTGDIIGGKYEVQEMLGEGMLGAVYKVNHKTTGTILALKIMRPQLVAEEMDISRFNQELELTKQLKHPGIVETYDTGMHEGTLFFTMEYVAGGSLRLRLNELRAAGEDMPPNEMITILGQTLQVLEHAHKTTIHRDLKPENILLDRKKGADGKESIRVKLADFGIAHVISPTIFAGSFLNREGAYYLAPEMTEFADKAAPNSDLYSIGAIFYEMLTGDPPIGQYFLVSEVREEISMRIDDVVEIAIAPNPQDRFQSAADMLAALKQTFAELFGSEPTPVGRLILLLVILAIAAGAASFYFKATEVTEEDQIATEMVRRGVMRKAHATAAAPAPATSDPKFADMVYIPGGEFLQGKFLAFDEGLGGELSERINSTNAYWIDKREMYYQKFEISEDDDEATVAEKQKKNLYAFEPYNDITWQEAQRECKAKGKRLCSEREWEKACKGPDNNIYAYGDTYDADKCASSGFFAPYKVTQFSDCVSGYGVEGLSGGLMEWTGSKANSGYIVKGGAVGNEEKGTRCANRSDQRENFSQKHVGLRCCTTAK